MITITRCSSGRHEEEEEKPQAMISMEKLMYAGVMLPNFRMVREDGRIWSHPVSVTMELIPYSQSFNPFYTDLVFVHSEEESIGFPDYVVVAWPREREFSQGIVNGLHWAVNRDAGELYARPDLLDNRRFAVTLEEFGLTYPITVEDLVDNWEKIDALWHVLDRGERSFIFSAAPYGGPLIEDDEDYKGNSYHFWWRD